ncbi:ankyrin repeat and death domain-containing protein 1A-like protein, partial [Leptotrombidium deliense]
MDLSFWSKLFDISSREDVAFHESIINNDISVVKKILESKINLDSKSHMERTACHWAAMYGHSEILAILIQAKCDIETTDKFGMTPLLVGCWYGHPEVVN